MNLAIALLGLLVLVGLCGALILRLFGIGVGAPLEARPLRTDPAAWARSEIGRLGFEPLGVFIYANPQKNGEPIERTILRSPDSRTLAATGETAAGVPGVFFLSIWEDGRYVLTRTPKSRLFPNRRTKHVLATFGRTTGEAWATHQAAVTEFATSRDLPETASNLQEAVANYQRAGSTFKRLMRRELVPILFLGVLEACLLIWATSLH